MSEWLEALVIFGFGAGTGALVLYFTLPARRQYGRLMRERDEARKALREYRQQVDHHFLHTAELVNDMTESYRRVHEHLSMGARDLCSEAGRRLAADASLDALPAERDGDDESGTPAHPPLDYAPSAKGTLSEDYGLDKRQETPFSSVDDLASPEEQPVEPPRDYAAGETDTDDEEAIPAKKRQRAE